MTTLRDHPLMRHHSAHNWPPVWTQASKNSQTVRGEVGVLRSIHLNLGLELHKIFLIIEHDGEYFIGTLMIDDAAFRRQVRELLQRHIGRSIKEIGDLDMSHTL
jgi:hypothetical protein